MSSRTRATSPSGIGAIATEYIPSRWERVGASANVGAGNRVHLHPIRRLIGNYTIDRLRYGNGTPPAGNVILGLYGRGTPNPYVPDGAPLLARTNAFVCPNNIAGEALLTVPATGQLQISITENDIAVPYWFVAIFNNVGNNIFYPYSHMMGGRVEIRYYNAGAFALADPCPATVRDDRAIVFEAGILSIP